MKKSPETRLWEKVDKTGECWLWTAPVNSSGYGQMYVEGRLVLVHRLAFELAGGALRKGQPLDHLCRTRRCVRFEHLEPVTSKENTLRGVSPNADNSRKTKCLRGHPLSGENLGWKKGKYGATRYCKTCKKALMAEWQRAHPEKVAANQRAMRERQAVKGLGHKTLQT